MIPIDTVCYRLVNPFLLAAKEWGLTMCCGTV